MQLDSWSIQSSSFHFGRHGLGQEQTMITMPSDSLFAALLARMARTYGAAAVEVFCRPFVDGNPPFVLSSTFPFAGEVRFFPLPLTANRGAEEVGVQAKSLKKVKFVSEEIFRSLLTGMPLAKVYAADRLLQNGEILVGAGDLRRLPLHLQKTGAALWENKQRPRVALDRATSASNLFHIGYVSFAEQCGLWFAVRWLKHDSKLQDLFANLIHELADAGFGAERSVGMGVAKVARMKSLELPDVKAGWVTLSRYLPREDEIAGLADAGSSYSIQRVGGWLDSPQNMGQRRRSVHLIEEGSVIGIDHKKDAPGRMVDVQPRYKTDNEGTTAPLGHAVYRCGFALAIGMQGGTI